MNPISGASLLKFLVWAALVVHAGLLILRSEILAPLWLGELVRFVPFYWVLLPLCLATVVSLFTRPVWMVLSLANVVLFAAFTMEFHWNGKPDSTLLGTQVRVVSYNIKALSAREREGGFKAIELEIEKYAPDIVALQDAQKWLAEGSNSAPSEAPPAFGLPYVVAFDQYVLASRYPLVNCKAGKLDASETPAPYLHCSSTIAGKLVHVVTVHFVSPRGALLATKNNFRSGIHLWKNNFSERLAQSQALLVDLSQVKTPQIVLGDFNASGQSPVMGTLKLGGLQDAFELSGMGWGYTHGHSLSQELDLYRIDHVMVSQGITPLKTVVGASRASEHKPVIADLLIQP
jgi:vancomycin resistance protein VanJ